jgi:hypothetical protein
MESLETRLNALATHPSTLANGIVNKTHAGPTQYLKCDLTDALVKKTNQRGIPFEPGFSDKLYSTFNKEPLKSIYYGMTRSGLVPADVINALTDWEKTYFFAGLDGRVPVQHGMTVPELVAQTIVRGISTICIKHNYNKRHVPSSHHTTYKNKPQTPYAADIGDACRAILNLPRATAPVTQPPQAVSKPVAQCVQAPAAPQTPIAPSTPVVPENLYALLSADQLNEDQEHRLCVLLENASDDTLTFLEEHYGFQKLGGYARKQRELLGLVKPA